MKTFVLAILLALQAPSIQAQTPETDAVLPSAVSVVLLSPEYAALVAQHVQLCDQDGRHLRLTTYSISGAGGSTTVILDFAQRRKTAVGTDPWLPYGWFFAEVRFGVWGERSLKSLIFKPSGPTTIGGGSVGN